MFISQPGDFLHQHVPALVAAWHETVVWVQTIGVPFLRAGLQAVFPYFDRFAEITIAIADHVVLWYMLALNSGYALLLCLAIPELWSQWHQAEDKHIRSVLGSDALPSISVLVPAYNEQASIVPSVMSFLTLEYPKHEVVLVNDGSKDDTLATLITHFELYEVPPAVQVSIQTKPVRAYYRSRRYARLLVLDKENGGKADSLNAALNAARHPYVLAVDADTVIEPDALLRLARPHMLGQKVAAVGGTVRVANGCRIEHGRVLDAHVDDRMLPGIQTVEYLRAFLFGRLGWNILGGNLIISGAFGMFNRSYLLAIGGYDHGNVTEDMDLVVRLHRWLRQQKIRACITFIPDPVAWTEVPTTLKVLGRQRERWHRGLIATMLSRREMLFNPRYGTIGMLAYPFYFFGEMLAPLVELFGYLVLLLGAVTGRLNGTFAPLFMGVAIGYGLLLSVWAILLEEVTFRRYTRPGDFWRLLGYAVVEAFGYRQITVWFRLQSFWKFAKGERAWGNMMREGFHSTKKKLTPFRSMAAIAKTPDASARAHDDESRREAA